MIIFDTETTGLDSAINNICQLSYIKVYDFERSKPMEICSAKNFFFTVDYVEPGAEKVHGLSIDKLRELSKCKRFKDFAEEIYEDFKNEDILCGHNVDFDIGFLIKELDEAGYAARDLLYKKRFCTMHSYTDILCLNWNDYYHEYKWPRLSEVVDYLSRVVDFIVPDKKYKEYKEYLEDKTKEIFNLDENVDFHDARLDVTTTREIALIYRNICGDLIFKDDDYDYGHKSFYFERMLVLQKNPYYKSLIYTLGINRVCREHSRQIISIKNSRIDTDCSIKPDCLTNGYGWMTGSTRRTVEIAFDLFNGFKPEEPETLTYLLGYNGEDTKYYIEALKLRFL